MEWLFKHRRSLGRAGLGLLACWQALQPQPWDQARVYWQLVRLDWEAEKRRLLCLWGYSLLGACFTLACLILAGGIALAISWHSAYFVWVCLLVIGAYSLAALGCVTCVLRLAKQGSGAFATSRHELKQTLVRAYRPDKAS